MERHLTAHTKLRDQDQDLVEFEPSLCITLSSNIFCPEPMGAHVWLELIASTPLRVQDELDSIHKEIRTHDLIVQICREMLALKR